jgi:hypothetical protein
MRLADETPCPMRLPIETVLNLEAKLQMKGASFDDSENLLNWDASHPEHASEKRIDSGGTSDAEPFFDSW